jgi:hypothetical protein
VWQGEWSSNEPRALTRARDVVAEGHPIDVAAAGVTRGAQPGQRVVGQHTLRAPVVDEQPGLPDRMFGGRPVIGIRNTLSQQVVRKLATTDRMLGEGKDMSVDEGQPEDVAYKARARPASSRR